MAFLWMKPSCQVFFLPYSPDTKKGKQNPNETEKPTIPLSRLVNISIDQGKAQKKASP